MAACIACLLVFAGGIGGVQYSANHQTINIGNTYLVQISSDISHMKGEASEEMYINLETLFSNVSDGKNLKSTIVGLQKAYELSKDEDSDYNYVHNTIAWNLAMAYLKAGNRRDAKPILETIIQDPDNENKTIRKQAQQVCDDIDSIFSLW